MLEIHMPFYQSAFGDSLEYELTFNDYNRVVVTAAGDANASNTSLEFDMVVQPDLVKITRNRSDDPLRPSPTLSQNQPRQVRHHVEHQLERSCTVNEGNIIAV